MVAVVAIVLAANLPYLLGVTDPNPLGPRSQVATAQPGLIRGANTLDPTDGLITQALGHLAATEILHGRLPWWNPYEGAGLPLAGEGQSAALFPPTLLLALDNGQFYEDVLLELVAGLGMFLLLRRIGVGRSASVAGAAAFALNGAFAWLATSTFNPVAFLPLLVLGIEHAYSASLARRRGGWWLIAVSLALSLYAGFPETAYIDALVATAWFGWRWWCADRQHLRRLFAKAAAGSGAGLLLAAPFLVAFIVTLPHEYTGIHARVAGHITMPRYALPQLLLPYVYGPPLAFSDPAGRLGAVWGYAGGFAGISVAFLATLSLLSSRRRGLKLVLGVWVLLVIAKVYGEPPVLRDLLLLVPGATSVAFYRYSFPAIDFALVVLAALGVDQLTARLARRRAIAAAALGMLAVIGVLALDARGLVVRLDGAGSHSDWARMQVAWTVGLVAVITIVVLRRVPPRTWILASIMVADVGLMFTIHELAASRSVRLDRAPVTYLQRHLGNGRFFTLGPIAPNYGGYWGIASLNDIDVPLPTAWTTYVNAHLDTHVNPVFFVGNSGGGRPLSDPSPEQELLANLSEYRDAGVRYIVTPPAQTRLQRSSSFELVLRRPTAWIYRLVGAAPYFSTRLAGCVTRADGRERVRLACPRPTTLLRRELDFPGWRATVDGHSTSIRTADRIYQSVPVPAGYHTVSFGYSPPEIGWALVGLLAGAGWLVFGGIAEPRRSRAGGEALLSGSCSGYQRASPDRS